ncbi:alpha/beta hydrolase [Natribacillus halophilus]|uniref:Carboxylesterase n=1 Tax=Natribacillus halophilus TaxID=549003 RepID=A0A1G8KKD7_9BACI|nr:alpha/beta fold hydrolase [Natribacillus halophilus]SDI43923.1 carboxylesterase [Natribacillus halophilus]
MKIVPPKPFTFEGDNGRAVLLLHGFTGSTADVRMLGRFLQRNGYTAHAPLFPGHGVPPEELLETGPEDWWGAVEDAYHHLRERGFEQMAVCGLSLGGLFTLKVGYTFRVKGIAPMCAPAIANEEDQRLYNGLLQYAKEYKQYEKKDEDTIQKEMDTFKEQPLNVLSDIQGLIADIRDHLHEIEAPVDIVQAGQDERINPDSAQVIYEKVSSEQKHLQMYDDAPHVITLWKEKEKVYEHILAFLEGLDWE